MDRPTKKCRSGPISPGAYSDPSNLKNPRNRADGVPAQAGELTPVAVDKRR
jgi:hypothetical protein